MGIKHKLKIGFGIVIAMLIMVTTVSIWSLQRSHQTNMHLESTLHQQTVLSRLLVSINQQMKELGEYIMLNDEAELTEFRRARHNMVQAFDEWKRLIVTELDYVGENHRREEHNEMRTWEQCRDQSLSLLDVCDRIINLVQTGENEKAAHLAEYQVEETYEHLVEPLIEEQLQDEQREADTLETAALRLYHFTWKLTVGLAIFTLIGANIASRVATRIIARPLTHLREAAARIGQGDLDTKINVCSHDEIGELAVTLNQMAQDLKRTTTSIDRLQHEVQQREKAESDLNAINEELTHFAYVVSHDLKAPLRGIKLLTEWLCTDYADQLSDDAQENLALLQNRVKRMHNLIEGVLQYSRVGRIYEHQTDVDLNAVLTSVIDTIAPLDHITITVEGTLPTITCEKTRLVQVFQNLLTNAVKYMDKPDGRIVIAHQDLGDTWQFNVSDNGPGIEECHFDRIFKIFQTLTSRDEFESTGVGLTLVKKIVELYGGRIWLESELGQGTTFHFTLPKYIDTGPSETPAEDAVSNSPCLQVAVTGASE